MSELLDSLLHELEGVERSFQAEIAGAGNASSLEALRIKYLGRKGQVAHYFKKMGEIEPAQRPLLGDRLNKLKQTFSNAVEAHRNELGGNGHRPQTTADLTLPGTTPALGYRNPLMIVLDEIKEVFANMGFAVETGPLIEKPYYNFEALNVPDDHPSKDLQDTFYLPNGLLLRTHTSPVQVRTMERQKPPIRIIAPGRCFRKDTPDATHSPEFHQVEGLAVGEGLSLAHLKGTLVAFARSMFGEQTEVRFRPSFFPFTEPSAEMDIYFDEKLGWLEILGSGMVHPNVLEGVGIDSERYTGFAFGMGVERITMLKYQIDDIRYFYDNDIHFLSQF